MSFRRRGFLQRNISKKDLGQVEWVTGMFFLLILGILLCTQLQLASWHTTSLYLEDALAASNLAAELIDVREYGMTNKVLITDPSEAYMIYCDAVKENLQLDAMWLCANRDLIDGPVKIADFIVYNVVDETVTASRVNREGYVSDVWSGVRGSMTAPNGIPVEHTGIYSEITFPVNGFLGIVVQAHKGKLTDIVSEETLN